MWYVVTSRMNCMLLLVKLSTVLLVEALAVGINVIHLLDWLFKVCIVSAARRSGG